MSLDYLIHDWGKLCRQLKPYSRTVFVDMGASLNFMNQTSPTMQLLETYRKFGFLFDHVYAYEMTLSAPDVVYSKIPSYLYAAYHWINVGVQSDPNHMHNPFKMILDNFNEDDLIVVKLDIDTPKLEKELVTQLENNPALLKLVDHFYFEHHCNQDEIKVHWGRTTDSVDDSFQLFRSLREKGVAAHFWV